MRWAGHVARMGDRRGVYRVAQGKSEGKKPLGRTRRRWGYNIKMDRSVMGRSGLDESSGGCVWGHGLDRSGSGEGR